MKDRSSEMPVDALRRTAQGEKIISPEIADTLAAHERTPILSQRQKDILQLVAKGFNNDEIAEQIGITRHGVKAHLAIAFQRLDAPRAETASLALSLDLI